MITSILLQRWLAYTKHQIPNRFRRSILHCLQNSVILNNGLAYQLPLTKNSNIYLHIYVDYSGLHFVQYSHTFKLFTVKMRQEIAIPKLPNLSKSRREPCNLSKNCLQPHVIVTNRNSIYIHPIWWHKWDQQDVSFLQNAFHRNSNVLVI